MLKTILRVSKNLTYYFTWDVSRVCKWKFLAPLPPPGLAWSGRRTSERGRERGNEDLERGTERENPDEDCESPSRSMLTHKDSVRRSLNCGEKDSQRFVLDDAVWFLPQVGLAMILIRNIFSKPK